MSDHKRIRRMVAEDVPGSTRLYPTDDVRELLGAYDELRGDMMTLSFKLAPDCDDRGLHTKPDVYSMMGAIERLNDIERRAARYLAALDGRLGPLDYATPDEELAALRELLAGSHAHMR